MRRLLSWMVTVMTGRAIADEDGFLAYEHGDYATAARIFRPLAEQLAADQGAVKAQSYLGFM